MSKRARRTFTPQQKSDAVRLVKQVGNLSQVSRDLDVPQNSLRRWVQQAEIDAGKGKRPTILPITHKSTPVDAVISAIGAFNLRMPSRFRSAEPIVISLARSRDYRCATLIRS